MLNNVVFISRDVKFFEHVFPYKVLKPKSDEANTPLSVNMYDDYDECLACKGDTVREEDQPPFEASPAMENIPLKLLMVVLLL